MERESHWEDYVSKGTTFLYVFTNLPEPKNMIAINLNPDGRLQFWDKNDNLIENPFKVDQSIFVKMMKKITYPEPPLDRLYKKLYEITDNETITKNDVIRAEERLIVDTNNKIDEETLSYLFTKAIRSDHKNVVMLLLSTKFGKGKEEKCLLDAVYFRKENIVITLLKAFDFSEDVLKEALKIAVYKHSWEIIEIILDNSDIDPSFDNNYLLYNAINTDQLQTVKTLLKYDVDPHVRNDLILLWASMNGYFDLLKELLKKYDFDKSVNKERAIQYAIVNGYKNIVLLLLDYSEYDEIDFDELIKTAEENKQEEIKNILISMKKTHEKTSKIFGKTK